MMPCCTPIIQSFFNKAFTTVSFPPSLQAIYGRYPKVQVLYYDAELDEYYTANMNLTRVSFDGNAVHVDHGGMNTGIIKVY